MALTRIKWFVPRDGQPYQPFGIDREGAATLYGHRGGWSRSDEATAQEVARVNRRFWAGLSSLPAQAPARPRRRRWRWRLRA
ncbi:hypothetical protein OG271_18005 [Micromonospora rifamycinica]|uniref:hypothetical protein n=1 Tax=Micromonospora rifamycinica TaxID=291594 RepID=UPI002E281C94|nr:hypothetical protein [Micromonospora rifamycinica]